MARDLRTNGNRFFNRCKMYKHYYDENKQLKHYNDSFGVFYSQEKQPMHEVKVPLDNGTQYILFETTIITNDVVKNRLVPKYSLEINDFVLYRDEMLRVNDIIEITVNESEQFQSRPNKTTEIVLVRV